MTDIVFAPGRADERVVGEDEIYSAQGVRFERTHTGIGTWRASVRPDPEWQDRFFEEVLIRRDDGTVLFRGILLTIDEQRGNAVTRLSGKGVAYDLQNDETAVTYQNILAHEAIRDYWANETSFNATVTDPTPAQTVDDRTVQTAELNGDFNSIASLTASDPLVVQNDTLSLAQAGFFTEGETATDSFVGAITTDSSYSNGEAASLFDNAHYVEREFTLSYTLPGDEIQWAIRVDKEDNETIPGFKAFIDNEELIDAPTGWTTTDSLFWFTQTNDIVTDLSDGTHTFRIELDGETNGSFDLDAFWFGDDRFTWNFDNTVDSNGYLSGPELYPEAYEVEFSEADTEFNITSGRIDSSWDDVSNQQRIQFNAGGAFVPTDGSEDNTQSVEESVSTPTRTIRGRARWSRYGSRTTASPTTGFNGQTLQSWDLQIDGNDLPIFEQREFEGSHLTNLQRLHEAADMRFVVQHEANTKPALSFQSGDVSRTLPAFNKRDESVRRSVDAYYNDVTVRGAIDDNNGVRLTASESDFDEVQQYGKQHLDVLRPDLDTLVAVEEEGKALLEQGLRERVLKGTLVVTPVDVLPGPSYPNPFDDSEDDVPLEEHRFRLSGDTVESQLVFDFRADDLRLAEDVGGLRGDVGNIGRGV